MIGVAIILISNTRGFEIAAKICWEQYLLQPQ